MTAGRLNRTSLQSLNHTVYRQKTLPNRTADSNLFRSGRVILIAIRDYKRFYFSSIPSKSSAAGSIWEGERIAIFIKNAGAKRTLLRRGTPEGTRTPNIQNRNLTLYPIELRTHISKRLSYYSRFAVRCKGGKWLFLKKYWGAKTECPDRGRIPPPRAGQTPWQRHPPPSFRGPEGSVR